uniref:Parvalbumin n=1 Tax=Salarias fasciatus TaxID=181472 RepID=A0A672FPQ8_SALFA
MYLLHDSCKTNNWGACLFLIKIPLCCLAAADSFCPKQFFQLCGLTKKSPQDVKKVFEILDNDGNGYIERDELKGFLQRFCPGARALTDKEITAFLNAADDDSDGRIGVDGKNIWTHQSTDRL